MSRLMVVRHAQASFFDADYDKLSPLGEEQAALLGKFWNRHGLLPDRIVCGPRQRHRRTAELVAGQIVDRRTTWPDSEISEHLDEHTLDTLLREKLSVLIPLYPHLGPMLQELKAAVEPLDVQRKFQRLFEALGKLWREAAPGTESIESWRDYRSRVSLAVRSHMEQASRNSTVVLFTSVGGVAAILADLLDCSDEQAFELGWRIRNCAVTEFVFSGSKVTLDSFNNLAHLPERHHWTFR